MANILVTGAWFYNKGAEAMMRSVQTGVLSQLPEAQGLLHAIAKQPPTASLKGLELWNSPYKSRTGRVRLAALARLGLIPAAVKLNHGLRRAFDLSAVIDVSGYAFGDAFQKPVKWSAGAFPSALKQALNAAGAAGDWALYHALRLPVFHLPQAWGPFEYREARLMAERIVGGAAKVYARDTVSYEYLQSLKAFSEDKVALASDIAFSFHGADPSIGAELLKGLGVRLGDRPLVGMVPNMRVYERAEGKGAQNAYVQRLIAITRWFTADRQCQVVLMPHEIKPATASIPDDRHLCRLVAEVSEDKEHVRAAVDDYSAEQLKSMIGQTELLVSSRFHSIIAAMSQRRPVVSLSWSHKYQELMKSVGLEQFVAPHDTDTEALLSLCEAAWESREDSSKLLAQHVPTHEASAAKVLGEVAEMIRKIP